MNHLPRDEAGRLRLAEIMFRPQPWDLEHLKTIRRQLSDGYVRNASRFENVHGDRTYGRLVSAFDYAAWRLEHQGAIHPDDLEIVEAYCALPRFTGSAQDDGVDFDGPRRRLTLALAAPLDQAGTPRDPATAKAA